ncbi:hypothetical protein GY45DRAFT_1368606 [Cubamyces sp. BRFM 1775]|nr:hypothetical protein GY45DRAFT_1368606 [Cubamyces sp. BRFM 1775]
MYPALVVYNWLINLDDEIKLFWSSPVKGASLLYFAIRYLAFLEPVLGIPTFFSLPDKVRSDFFSANRAYALSEQTRFIYCAVLVLALCPFFVNLIDGIVWTTPVNLPPPMFCSFEDNTPASLNHLVLLLLNVGHLIMTELSLTIPVEATSYLTIFIDPLMSILATDFLLNLQKATVMLSHADSDPAGRGELPSLNFAVITQSNPAGTLPDIDDADVPNV